MIMEDSNWFDGTILRLRRQYSKDELVSAMNKQMAAKDIEIGQLKSEIDHIKDEFRREIQEIRRESNAISNEGKKAAKREDAYRAIVDSNTVLKRNIRKLKIEKDRLIFELCNLKNK